MLHISYKNTWFFQKFCPKWCWKVQHWIIIHQHFEIPGKIFPNIFRWGNLLNVCNVAEAWKKFYKSYRSFHNFCQKRSSKLQKWSINCFNFESYKSYCWSLEIKNNRQDCNLTGTLRKCHKNDRSFLKFCDKGWSKLQEKVIIC